MEQCTGVKNSRNTPVRNSEKPGVNKNERGKNRKAPAEGLFGDPAGARTQDPYIKSVMLYQLSYGIVF